MFKNNNKNTSTTSLTLFWWFYCSLWTYFTPFSCVLIVDFEHVNVSRGTNSIHWAHIRQIFPINISWRCFQRYEDLKFRNHLKHMFTYLDDARSSLQQSSSHWTFFSTHSNPAGIYLPKVNNRNTRTRCEICSKLTIETPERSGVVILNFKHI